VNWLVSIVAGVLGAPVGFAAGTAVAYGVLTLRGISEREGRRGLLAGTIGGPVGIVAGFMLSFRGAWWILGGGGGSARGLLAGCLFAIPSGLIAGVVGLVLGTHMAERRGVTNYAGERAAWGLYYVAIPALVLTAAAGFLLGFRLTR
jgi:hypothetical protein